MSGGSALQGTSVCVARAPIGARLPPLPAENLEISPPWRSIAPRIAYATTPVAAHYCARGAASPAAQIPPSATVDIWLCTESGLGRSRPEIRSSTKDVRHLYFPAGLVQTQAA